MKFNLKVFINKRNGQAAVHLPKKIIETMPKRVEVKVPKEYIKKIMDPKVKWK